MEEGLSTAVTVTESAALKPKTLRTWEDEDLPPSFKNLFLFIDAYVPQQRPIPAVAKPFIPDYLPAFGDVDDFIRVPRPDSCSEHLGIEVVLHLEIDDRSEDDGISGAR